MTNTLMRALSRPAMWMVTLTLSGCYGMQDANNSDATNNIEPCEAIRTLTESYQHQFQDIRKAQRSHDRITIWSTDYQVVGNGCEIWGWQGGNYNYVCNYVAPDQQSAENIYQKAKSTIGGCLPEEWQLHEEPLGQPPGSKAVFSLPTFSGVVDLRLVQTRGITTPRWAIYLMIGDYNSQI
jgi:hypothetical protein